MTHTLRGSGAWFTTALICQNPHPRSLPGSLYATSSLFGTLRSSEASIHRILWSRSTAIPTISRILDPIREFLTMVIDRVLPHPNQWTVPSYPSILPFQCTLPTNSMSPATPPNYEGNRAKIVSSATANTMQVFGDDVSPPYHHVHTRKSSSPIPVHPKTQTSQTQRTCRRRKCRVLIGTRLLSSRIPSTRSPDHVCGKAGHQYLIPLVARPHHTPSWPYPIFVLLRSSSNNTHPFDPNIAKASALPDTGHISAQFSPSTASTWSTSVPETALVISLQISSRYHSHSTSSVSNVVPPLVPIAGR